MNIEQVQQQVEEICNIIYPIWKFEGHMSDPGNWQPDYENGLDVYTLYQGITEILSIGILRESPFLNTEVKSWTTVQIFRDEHNIKIFHPIEKMQDGGVDDEHDRECYILEVVKKACKGCIVFGVYVNGYQGEWFNAILIRSLFDWYLILTDPDYETEVYLIDGFHDIFNDSDHFYSETFDNKDKNKLWDRDGNKITNPIAIPMAMAKLSDEKYKRLKESKT